MFGFVGQSSTNAYSVLASVEEMKLTSLCSENNSALSAADTGRNNSSSPVGLISTTGRCPTHNLSVGFSILV